MTEEKIRRLVREESELANKTIEKQLEIVSKAVIGNGNTKDCLVERTAKLEEKDTAMDKAMAWIWSILIAMIVALLGFAFWGIKLTYH